MAFIEWKQDFSVGNVEIDAQHQKLVGLLNELHEAMSQGVGKIKAGEIVLQMVEYSRYHFAFEEKFMRSISYSDLDAHIKEHEAFTSKAIGFEKDIQEGKFNTSISIATFLKDWLTNHILKVDKKYSVHNE